MLWGEQVIQSSFDFPLLNINADSTGVADSCSVGSRWCYFILYSGYQKDKDYILINIYFIF